jgi:60 kDa SS-A/Ro ribonucleoprotein
MKNILQMLGLASGGQRVPLLGEAMVANDAGGYVYALDDWARLDRFLILGSEGGTFYASELRLTRENATVVQRCIAADGARAVVRIVEISVSGRAPKQEPALFALALATAASDPATRAAALAAIPKVARTGAQLQRLVGYIDGLRGWGRGLRRAVARWYVDQPLGELELQALKYKTRGEKGERWSHRDLLRLAHPLAPAEDVARRALFDRIVRPEGRPDGAGELPAELARYAAAERLLRTTDADEAVRLILEHRLPREVVPTALLGEAKVWEALLSDMPMTALLRSLGKLSQVGLLVPGSDAERQVLARLNYLRLQKQRRVHPLQMLTALAVYRTGHGLLGKLSWVPAPSVVDALDRAFYGTFDSVQATGKRLLIGLDVSGSMSQGQVAGSPLTPREAATAMALVTLATEPAAQVAAFCDTLVPLALSARQRLDDAVKATSALPFGRTDCAQPMLYALANRLEVDAFVIYTDNETWAGAVHPTVALRQYRQESGIAARLVVVGLTSTGFTIADPADAGMLDVVGFDAAAPALIGDFVAGRL